MDKWMKRILAEAQFDRWNLLDWTQPSRHFHVLSLWISLLPEPDSLS